MKEDRETEGERVRCHTGLKPSYNINYIRLIFVELNIIWSIYCEFRPFPPIEINVFPRRTQMRRAQQYSPFFLSEWRISSGALASRNWSSKCTGNLATWAPKVRNLEGSLFIDMDMQPVLWNCLMEYWFKDSIQELKREQSKRTISHNINSRILSKNWKREQQSRTISYNMNSRILSKNWKREQRSRTISYNINSRILSNNWKRSNGAGLYHITLILEFYPRFGKGNNERYRLTDRDSNLQIIRFFKNLFHREFDILIEILTLWQRFTNTFTTCGTLFFLRVL